MAVQKNFSKRDFSAGQYDREYRAAQTTISSRGMEYCRNVISSPLRELKTRPGTKFLMGLDKPTVLIPYRIKTDDIVLAVQDDNIKAYKIDGNYSLVEYMNNEPISPQFPSSGWDSDTNGNWTVDVNNILTSGKSYMCFSDATTRGYTIWSNDSWPQMFLTMETSGEPCILGRIDVQMNTTGSTKTPYAIHAFVSPIIQYSDDGIEWVSVETRSFDPDNPSIGYKVTKVPMSGSSAKHTYVSYRVEPSQVVAESHKYWRLYWSNKIDDGGLWSSTQAKFTNIIFNSASKQFSTDEFKVSENQLQNIKYSQQDNMLVITEGTAQPFQVALSEGRLQSESFVPSDYDDIWTYYGYPTCVRFFQNRLWFGGFELFPTRAIASKFGDINTFKVPTANIDASSPISTDCNQFKYRITDLFGGWDVLYAQSTEGIATIEAGNSAIAPNNMNFLLKVDKRSSGITPAVKNNMMFFVGYDRKSIYAIQFDLIADKYQIADVTQFSHSFLKPGITEIHYVDTEARLIYGALQNGEMFALLYDADSQTVGLFPLGTDGIVYDLSVVQINNTVRLLGVIQRNGQYGIEMFNPVIELDDTDSFEISKYDANQATKNNLIKQPYIDCALTAKNEVMENWTYNAVEKILYPTTPELEHSDLSLYMQHAIRCFVGDKPYDLKIVGYAYGEQEITKVITENTEYYGWYSQKISVNDGTQHEVYRLPAYDRVVSGVQYYAWASYNATTTIDAKYFTRTDKPSAGVIVYTPDSTNRAMQNCGQVSVGYSIKVALTLDDVLESGGAIYDTDFKQTATVEYANTIAGNENSWFIDGSHVIYYKNESANTIQTTTRTETTTENTDQYKVEFVSGDSDTDIRFNKLQFPIYEIKTQLGAGNQKYQYIDSGRYMGNVVADENGVIHFDEPVYDCIYGLPYRKIAVISGDDSTYLRKKKWGSIALNVMDTMSLQIGARIDKMEDVMKWKGEFFYDSSPIMQNGILIKNIADSPEADKKLILMTDEGLPFCIRAIEASGDITDRNAN